MVPCARSVVIKGLNVNARNSQIDRVLLELARRDKSDFEHTLRAVTEAGAVALGVARCSVWQLVDEQSAIVCKNLYLPDSAGHMRGDKLFARDTPNYFRALLESRAIPAHDARTDPRTAEFREGYLEPLGITSMMDVPIWHRGDLYGVLCNEHVGPPRKWQAEEVSFATNLADLVSLSLEAAERVAVERRWETVVEAITEAVVLLDAQGNVVLANPAAKGILERFGGGASFAERIRLAEYRDTMDRPIPADRWPFPRAMRGEIIRGEIFGVLSRQAGRVQYFRLTMAPLREGDRITSIVAVIGDVSQEVELERLKREFLSALAHELKTPVAITKGYAQILEQVALIPETSRPMLESIVRSANRMQHLIADLMDVASITLGQLALLREHVDLGSAARAVIERVRPSAPRHRFRIMEAEPVSVLADRARIEQVIRQFVENAVRYSPAGGAVDVEVRRQGPSAVLAVSDQGIGIPADRQKRIFELFYRAHAGTPHDFGGLGIGLYLGRQIAAAHGGSIQFQSTEGKGSTFTLRIPIDERSEFRAAGTGDAPREHEMSEP